MTRFKNMKRCWWW